jgi:hypothetical protein
MSQPVTAHDRFPDDDEVIESSPRSFGFLFAVVFSIIGVLPLWNGRPMRIWSLVTASVFFLVALVGPAALAPMSRLWQQVGLLLHRLVNPVVMAVLFYVVITPFGVAMRLFGRGLSTQLSRDRAATTYWRSRTQSPSATMRNQF